MAEHLLQGTDGAEMHGDAALVVGSAAAVEAAVAHRRLERRGRPQREVPGGLYVVVGIEDHARRPTPCACDDSGLPALDREQIRLHSRIGEEPTGLLRGLVHGLTRESGEGT